LERELLMRAVVRLAALVAALVGLEACFAPEQPPCAFECGPAGECPEDYVCAPDHLCHRADGVGVCRLPPGDGGTSADQGTTEGRE
jgi:hypothetical protein